MTVFDYIYIDDARIDSYAQQANLHRLLRRFPKWLSEISFSGIKLSLSQPDRSGEQSRYEKIAKVIQYLKDKDELKEGRPGKYEYREDLPKFLFENCTAVKAQFPQKDSSEIGFSVWISDENQYEIELPCPEFRRKDRNRFNFLSRSNMPGKLFLLEDLTYEDFSPSGRSPYTVLWSLGLILEKKIKDMGYQWQSYNQLEEKLAKQPLETFEKLGAQLGPRRKIAVLYQLRDLCREPFSSQSNDVVTVIGYPLFIMDNSIGGNLGLQDIGTGF